jgi:hypothetical protein
MTKKMNRKLVIAIGYWYAEDRSNLPDPAWFIDDNYPEAEKKKVIDYLKKGKRINLYKGWSNCRICGAQTPGGSDDTDGIYIFPSGLVHYVEKHNLRLPDEFIKRIDENKSSLSENYVDMSNISINSASFDWWYDQKGIDPTRSSKNNANGQNLKLDFLEDDLGLPN